MTVGWLNMLLFLQICSLLVWDDRGIQYDDWSVQAVYVRFNEREPRHGHSNVAAELHECVRRLKQLVRNFDDRSSEAHYGYGA